MHLRLCKSNKAIQIGTHVCLNFRHKIKRYTLRLGASSEFSFMHNLILVAVSLDPTIRLIYYTQGDGTGQRLKPWLPYHLLTYQLLKGRVSEGMTQNTEKRV